MTHSTSSWRGRSGTKPAVIEDYNMYMGGVDKSDQLLNMVSDVAQRSGGSVPSSILLNLQW